MNELINSLSKIEGINPNDEKKTDNSNGDLNNKQPQGEENNNINQPKENKPLENNENKELNPKIPGEPGKPPVKKKNKIKTWIWILIGILLFLMFWSLISASNVKYLSYSEFFQKLADNGYAPKVYLEINNGYYVMANFSVDRVTYIAYFDSIEHFNQVALDNGVPAGALDIQPINPQPGLFAYLLVTWLPWMVMLVIAWVIIKKITESQSSVGKMQKKNLLPQMSNIKFENVEGYKEVKQELFEIVDFLKQPAKYNEAGARTPKGVLLSGPPGTGKTLFAKAVAGESGIPFYSISGSDFVEMFVGVGASRVRSLFQQAKKTAPSLIFIDELDAVGRSRSNGYGSSNDEREQTLNQLLVEMDGFESNSGIIIIAATNRPDVLDPALKRPGRFDRSIEIRLPDVNEREAILKLHSKKGNKKFSKDIVWVNIASRTPGFSGAELENVINESVILMIREGTKEVTLAQIDEAIDRVIGGPAKVHNTMSKEEKELVAYHEAGHALIGLKLEHAEKVQKISIVPRGSAGGYVMMTPKKEKFVQTKNELLAKITSYMGGRASEEIFFGSDEITTGASSDIEEATKIAKAMVSKFGMTNLGKVRYSSLNDYNSPYNDLTHSDKTNFEIDQEIRTIIEESYKEATTIISENKPLIKLFAKALLLKEVLSTEDIEYIYENNKLTKEILEIEKKLNKSNKKPKESEENDKK